MKRFLIMCFFVFLITGCTSEVNITIDKNNIEEKITVIGSDQSEYDEIKNWNGFPLTLYYDQELENPFSSGVKENGVKYYSVENNENEKKVNASATFTLQDHVRSSLIRGCFEFYNIVDSDNNTKIFSTSNGLICNFTDFKIIVYTPYEVVNSNAHEIDSENHTYIWKVNSSNERDISVYLEIDFSEDDLANEKDSPHDDYTNNDNNKDLNISGTIIFCLVAFIIIVILVIVIILRKKQKKMSAV